MKLYLMLDDDAQSEAPAEDYSEAIERVSGGALQVLVRKPLPLPDTIALIREIKPAGLFLDVQLINALDDSNKPLGFDGIALAQQVRTLQTRARAPGSSTGLPEFPIIRLSKKDVIREYVNEDSTSDDLFDELIDKDRVLTDPIPVAQVASALAEDYGQVCHFANGEATPETLSALLAWPVEQIARLDPRTLLGLQRPGAPPHVLARFIVTKLLGRPGPLIGDALLAVRLGVDRENSPDWDELVKALSGCAYRGAFAAGYPRWWMTGLLDWWQDVVDADQSPARLSASQRVERLAAELGLPKLQPIMATADSPGERVWHLCQKSGRPVDMSEGFPLLPV